MKKIMIIIGILISNLAISQDGFRFNPREYFTVSLSVDPTSSIKENGLDIVSELEYVGPLYAKVGFESFSALTGGYRDFHFSIGPSFTSGYFENIRYYTGFRMARVDRGPALGVPPGAFRINYGLEAGIDYDISDDFFVGLRATLDKRYDQEIFGWTPETKFSGFIRVGYKWYYKNRRP
jgi:hypothetical protein